LKAKELNVYSARHYDTDISLYETFEEKTGVKINLIEGKADALIERIHNERELSPADLLITVDAGRLWRAKELDLFQKINSKTLNDRIPENLRDPQGYWFGLSTRARVIVINNKISMPLEINNYKDLANPLLKESICMRSSSNIYNISLMASIIHYIGEENAKIWAKGVVANFARQPQGNDTAQIKAVARGACKATIANTYYIARLMNTDKKIFDNIKVIFPNQNDRGTHINISGAGIIKYSKNYNNAIMFLEYLTSKFAQTLFSDGNNEYAIYGKGNSKIYSLGEFKRDKLESYILGKNQVLSAKVYDTAGWK
tara:strand:- start:19 stop:960 length:942 start_codon:yes stop_codon:yes gene_type:complete